MDIATVTELDTAAVDDAAARAARVFESGGLVVFPTETVYGVGASAASPTGYDALLSLKGRESTQPFSIHCPTPASAARLIDSSDPTLRRLVRKVMPGPVTLIVEVSNETIDRRMAELGLPPEARGRIYHNNTVGLRCPDHAVGQRILGCIDAPIVASSANRRGQPPPRDAQAAGEALAGAAIGLMVDGGPARFAKGSTIIRVNGGGAGVHFTVERNGVYDERFIRKLMRWTLLFVCSGNTCRSPMAEMLAKDILAKERSIAIDDLPIAGVRVLSAGVFAAAGSPAAPQAVEAMGKLGLDLSQHRSRTLTAQMVQEADVVYCMTQAHRESVLALAPDADDKVMMLDPTGDIEDPIGASSSAYKRCAELIRRRLMQHLKEATA